MPEQNQHSKLIAEAREAAANAASDLAMQTDGYEEWQAKFEAAMDSLEEQLETLREAAQAFITFYDENVGMRDGADDVYDALDAALNPAKRPT